MLSNPTPRAADARFQATVAASHLPWTSCGRPRAMRFRGPVRRLVVDAAGVFSISLPHHFMKTETTELWSREGVRWKIELHGQERDGADVLETAFVKAVTPGAICLHRWRTMAPETLCALTMALLDIQEALEDFNPERVPDVPMAPGGCGALLYENEAFAVMSWLSRHADGSIVDTIGVHDAGDRSDPVFWAEGDEFSEMVEDFVAAQQEIHRCKLACR
jgi:hypothetical protein